MSVDARHPEFSNRYGEWTICRDFAAGELQVKAKRTTYLPLLEGQKAESEPAYKGYLNRAMFYPAFDRTVTGLSGMVLRRPSIVHVPRALVDLLEDLTLEREGGLNGVLVRVLREVLTVGRLGVFADWNEDLKRPYWSLYHTEQIINWKEARINGVWTPTLVVLEEEVAEPGRDAWSWQTVTQWRELFLDPATGVFKVNIWRKNTGVGAGDAQLIVVESKTPTRKGEPLRQIPFVGLTPRGGGLSPAKPPLLDLALVNASHYRSSADLEHGRHFCALPTPWVTGWTGTGEDLKIGSGTAWLIPAENAKVGMLEFTGGGLGSLEKALEDKEKVMATIGARLLEEQPRAAETAEAVRMRQGGDHTSLATIVASVSAGLTFALQWSGWWTGLDLKDKNVELSLNADFAEASLSAQEVDSLMKLWQAGGISYETLYYNLQAGEIARPGIEVTEEREAIDAEDALDEAKQPLVDDSLIPDPEDRPDPDRLEDTGRAA